MAKIHGKGVSITVGAADVSPFANNVEFGREAEAHDSTTFGATSKAYTAGLKDGSITVSGLYDSAATGPRTVLEPLLGTSVVVVYKPEGTGTGKPTKTVTAIMTSYNETAPVADMVTWTSEYQMSGDVVTTTGP